VSRHGPDVTGDEACIYVAGAGLARVRDPALGFLRWALIRPGGVRPSPLAQGRAALVAATDFSAAAAAGSGRSVVAKSRCDGHLADRERPCRAAVARARRVCDRPSRLVGRMDRRSVWHDGTAPGRDGLWRLP